MNRHVSDLSALTEILGALGGFAQPADLTLRNYFRAHPGLGQKDRARLAETAFAWLRHWRTMRELAGDDPRAHALLALKRFGGLSARELSVDLSAREREWLRQALAREPSWEPAARAELPDWLYERLAAQWGATRALDFGRSVQQAAALDLRVNTERSSRDELQAALIASGIACAPTPYSPLGLRLVGKPALQNHALFRVGHFEVQDEGSQLIGLLVQPTRRHLVVDLCAGAGGKTLALAAAMRGQGQIYACDLVERRLRSLRERLTRSGLSNVQPWQIDGETDPKLARLAGKADRVLVDAPCSGFGTLRRNPDLKWRHGEQAITELVAKQKRILGAAAALVKPGGRLIYATCSILEEENEQQVEVFLRDRPDFRPLSAAVILAAAKLPLDTGPYLRLLPEIHACDGFFAAVLERRESREALPD
ncbi:MAG: RsmB/NOP family class I SAM-dependent RNA methyltransferase [Burkholderiales bacterium]|nr:MAG: RsmB/NOP family class I SAM-dependent RNA methyltransferase [Burkholderiales bacterium]